MKNSSPWLIAQTIIMYVLQVPIAVLFISVFNNIEVSSFLLTICLVFLGVGILFSIVNLILSIIRFCFDIKCPYKTTFICKLALIPWYLINFYFCFVLFAGFLNPFLLIAIPVLIALEVSITYLFMISTSMPNIVYILKGIITKKIERKSSNILLILIHFIFCLDLLGSILIFKKENKEFSDK